MEALLPWLRRVGWVYVLVALALAAVAWRLGGADRAEPTQPSATGTARVAAAAPGRALVHVAGEVRRPGVYRVPVGARVVGALRRAGGPTRRADLGGLNLAARVQDGQQVVVPPRGPAGASGGARAAAQPVERDGRRARRPRRAGADTGRPDRRVAQRPRGVRVGRAAARGARYRARPLGGPSRPRRPLTSGAGACGRAAILSDRRRRPRPAPIAETGDARTRVGRARQ